MSDRAFVLIGKRRLRAASSSCVAWRPYNQKLRSHGNFVRVCFLETVRLYPRLHWGVETIIVKISGYVLRPPSIPLGDSGGGAMFPLR